MMKVAVLVLSILSLAAPSFAQAERGYIGGIGGFAVSAASTSPRVTSQDWAFEAGARVAPGLLAFGDFGRINDLSPSTSQPDVATAVSTLSSTDAVDVVGTARMPARYALGGLRWQPRTPRRVVPFITGGLGVAHLTPTARFTFTDGTLPNADPAAAPPNSGDDVTAQVSTLGVFAPPAPSTAMMIMGGGGAEFDLARHWAVDTEYRISRISASTPLHAQGLAFGLGYRF
jgi:opacity protein-like surface antigen